MQKLFEFEEHIGKYRVLIQTRDMQNGSITTDKIANEAVTPEKLSESVKNGLIRQPMEALRSDLQAQIAALEEVMNEKVDSMGAALRLEFQGYLKTIERIIADLNEGGIVLADRFGDNPHIGISQMTLTNAINRIWQKIEELTGEISHGITLTVDKEYFVSEDGADLHITVNPVDSTDIFEHVSLYANGVLIDEKKNVEDLYTVDYHIEESTLIRCEAKILGIPYEDKAFVAKYNSFWIGGGNSYLDVMQTAPIPIESGMRGHYPVAVGDGEHIIVVVGEHLANGFIRADMNGVEIAFTLEEGVEVDGKKYNVYTSVNTFNEGTYDIDVNG